VIYKMFGKLGRAPCTVRETSAPEIKEQVFYFRQTDVPGSQPEENFFSEELLVIMVQTFTR